uniref:Putative secreted protein n=1 Tax=Ixodes ricinus TaxID=34613 RepID=A0A6B0UQK6_IXORI
MFLAVLTILLPRKMSFLASTSSKLSLLSPFVSARATNSRASLLACTGFSGSLYISSSWRLALPSPFWSMLCRNSRMRSFFHSSLLCRVVSSGVSCANSSSDSCSSPFSSRLLMMSFTILSSETWLCSG